MRKIGYRHLQDTVKKARDPSARKGIRGRVSNRRKQNNGSSLVDVMVGVTILGLVFATSFAATGQGLSIIESARDHTRAAQILQSEVERIRTLNWSALEALPSTGAFSPGAEFSDKYANRYHCARDIGDRRTNQKLLNVTVSWTAQDGILRNRSYFTYITKEGINDFYYRTF